MVAFKKLIKVVELQEMSVTFVINNCGVRANPANVLEIAITTEEESYV